MFAQIVFDVPAVQRRPAEDHRRVDAALVERDEVFLHDDGGLHQQPAHADGVGPGLLEFGDHRVDRLLDADVVDLVAVVREDDVHEVLADVVDVALHGGEDDLALLLAFGLLHELFEVRDRGLHHLGGLQHERQLHLPAAEQVADDLHAVEQDLVDDVDGRVLFAGRVEVGDERFAAALDDGLLQPLFDGVAERLALLRSRPSCRRNAR